MLSKDSFYSASQKDKTEMTPLTASSLEHPPTMASNVPAFEDRFSLVTDGLKCCDLTLRRPEEEATVQKSPGHS